MFERFTKRARHVIVLAQDEARGLRHNYIGTEHLLLGLLGEPDGIAARALGRFGMSLDAARAEVTAQIGVGKAAGKGHLPLTPRSKKVLELALREARNMRHEYIGTEHLLLGMLGQADGAGPRIIAAQCADLLTVRVAVLDLLPAPPAVQERRWPRRAATSAAVPGEPREVQTTPAADTSLDEAARLAGPGPVGSHHLMLAALADPETAAARVLTGLGVDLDRAREALRQADVTGTSDEQPAERGRKQMLVRTTGTCVTIEVTDPAIINLGRAAAEALGDQAGSSGSIRGDLPASASLVKVWEALRDSLTDIRRRAISANGTPVSLSGPEPGED